MGDSSLVISLQGHLKNPDLTHSLEDTGEPPRMPGGQGTGIQVVGVSICLCAHITRVFNIH